MKKNKGFTIIELLAVVAISAVLLLLVTDRFIIGAFEANNQFNRSIDLQNGVKTSLDKTKNILRKSTQVHLVGKEVYRPDMDLGVGTKLDKNFSYIAFREKGGSRYLANLVFNSVTNSFDEIPLTVRFKDDIMKSSDINYSFHFYKGDSKYKNKMSKNILNLTVTGTSNSVGSDEKKFELSEDILLSNVNQILVSRHLSGGIEDITAIAYDYGIIGRGDKTKGKVGIVFVVDNSGSMVLTMAGNQIYKRGYNDYVIRVNGGGFATNNEILKKTVYSFRTVQVPNEALETADISGVTKYKYNEAYFDNTRGTPHYWGNGVYKKVHTREKWFEAGRSVTVLDSQIKEEAISVRGKTMTRAELESEANDFKSRKVIAGSVIKNSFLVDINKMIVDNGIDASIYMFPYDSKVKIGRDPSSLMVWDNTQIASKYGPYNLKTGANLRQAQEQVGRSDGLNMGFVDAEYDETDVGYLQRGTNTGGAIMQGLSILKNLRNQGVEHRYLILLTDGRPGIYYTLYGTDWDGQPNRYLKQSQGQPENVKGYADTHPVPLKYIGMVTREMSNNDKDVFNKAYVIGFSSVERDKSAIGFADTSGVVSRDSIKSYLEQNTVGVGSNRSKEVLVYDTSGSDELKKAMQEIIKDIGVSMKVFDGPEKIK